MFIDIGRVESEEVRIENDDVIVVKIESKFKSPLNNPKISETAVNSESRMNVGNIEQLTHFSAENAKRNCNTNTVHQNNSTSDEISQLDNKK